MKRRQQNARLCHAYTFVYITIVLPLAALLLEDQILYGESPRCASVTIVGVLVLWAYPMALMWWDIISHCYRRWRRCANL